MTTTTMAMESMNSFPNSGVTAPIQADDAAELEGTSSSPVIASASGGAGARAVVDEESESESHHQPSSPQQPAQPAPAQPINEKNPYAPRRYQRGEDSTSASTSSSSSDSGDTADTCASDNSQPSADAPRTSITVRQVQQNTFRNILQGLGPGAYACRRIYPGQEPTPEVDPSLQTANDDDHNDIETGNNSNLQDPRPDEDVSAALAATLVDPAAECACATSAVVVVIAEPVGEEGFKDNWDNDAFKYVLSAFLVVLLVAIIVNASVFL